MCIVKPPLLLLWSSQENKVGVMIVKGTKLSCVWRSTRHISSQLSSSSFKYFPNVVFSAAFTNEESYQYGSPGRIWFFNVKILKSNSYIDLVDPPFAIKNGVEYLQDSHVHDQYLSFTTNICLQNLGLMVFMSRTICLKMQISLAQEIYHKHKINSKQFHVSN